MNIKKSQVLEICKKLKKELIEYYLLGRGGHNENYLIETKQGKLVLRIENNLQFKNLKTEYNFLKKTKGRLGPRVYYFDNSKKLIPRDFIIQEFIEGKHPEKITKDIIISMAEWYKKLHKDKSNNIPTKAKEKNIYSLNKYIKNHTVRRYNKFKNTLNKETLDELDKLFVASFKIINKNDKIFSKRRYFSLNHGDPTRQNIFYKKGSLKLIDWEFVRYDLKEWDLVFFVWAYDLNNKRKELFLNKYNYKKTTKAKKQFEIIYLTHCLDMLNWRIERLNLIYKKKINASQMYNTEEEMLNGIYEDIPKLKESIKRFSNLSKP